VSYDPVDVLARFAAREKVAFTLLSDPKSANIGEFGLIDGSAPPGSDWYGFAHPITFVINPDGIIRHRFSEPNYQQRPDVDVVIEILRKETKG
jgi:peroxiredoxin